MGMVHARSGARLLLVGLLAAGAILGPRPVQAAAEPAPGWFGARLQMPNGEFIYVWLRVLDVRVGSTTLLQGVTETESGARFQVLNGVHDNASGKAVVVVLSPASVSFVMHGAYRPEQDAFVLVNERNGAQVPLLRTRREPSAPVTPPTTGGPVVPASLAWIAASLEPTPIKAGSAATLKLGYSVPGPIGQVAVSESIKVITRGVTKAERTVQRTANVVGASAAVASSYDIRCGDGGEYVVEVTLSSPGRGTLKRAFGVRVTDSVLAGDAKAWYRSGPVIKGRESSQTALADGFVPRHMRVSGTAVTVTNPANGKSVTVTYSEPPAQLMPKDRLKVDISVTPTQDVSVMGLCEIRGLTGPPAHTRTSFYVATYMQRYSKGFDQEFNPPGTEPITLNYDVGAADHVVLAYTYTLGGAAPGAVTITDTTSAASTPPVIRPESAVLGGIALPPARVSVPAVTGWVEYLAGDGRWQPLQSGSDLGQGTQVRSGANGSAVLVMPNGDLIRLDPNSTVTTGGLPGKPLPKSAIGVAEGGLLVSSSSGGGTAVATPSGVFTPRGTAFVVRHDPVAGRSFVATHMGEVVAQAAQPGQADVTVVAGFQAQVTAAGAGAPEPLKPTGPTAPVGGDHGGVSGEPSVPAGAVVLGELGLTLSREDGVWTIVHLGAAAREQAGDVRPGDELVKVGATSTDTLDTASLLRLLREPKGAQHSITVRRPDLSFEKEYTYTPR